MYTFHHVQMLDENNLETMVEHAKEAHQHEIDKNHYGDKQPCSYCEDIKVANEAIAKARGEA